MVRPAAPPGTPPGLEYFAVLSRLWVKQMPQWWDQITTQDINQVYHCLTDQGAPLYLIQETSDFCSLQLCGSHRGFIMNVLDAQTGQQVLTLTRPCRLNSSCFLYVLPCNWCFLQDLTVQDGLGNVIGHVTQPFSLSTSFRLRDSTGTELMYIKTPMLMFNCLGDLVFPVISSQTGQQIGSVTKKWGGVVAEEFVANEDHFSCEFPMDLPINAKALIFASTFLLDYMYFLDRNKPKPPSNNNTTTTSATAELATAENDLARLRNMM
jgi:hypothetical protein